MTDTPVRMGVVGIGAMGSHHAAYLRDGAIPRATLSAVCDIDAAQMAGLPDTPQFQDAQEMIASGLVDAVLVATPHYAHTTIGMAVLQAGLHLLVEKPISVHKADCERLIGAWKGQGQVFAAMFNQRTTPAFKRLKKLIERGEFGRIHRVEWVCTDWFRTNGYYAQGSWRATWDGEGGGVLLNQAPHQLDMFTWLFGMPDRVTAFCRFGSQHPIEVEDRVTAYLEYANGMEGLFLTATGEAPGTNRLEIAAERGRVVLEGQPIEFIRNEIEVTPFLEDLNNVWAVPDRWRCEIHAPGGGGQHKEITHNFVDAILDGAPLIAPASEGIRSVELANAMIYSTLLDRAVDLPLDGSAYEAALGRLRAGETARRGMLAG